ncbi:hypothetical protein SAY86_018074 [Trapa natans]|uniref:BHLH domain-containing protein n=1 Tax=Trapa natans TaxID=22666 RepID=A0AAN7R1B6_TRANT|nr:hypothetical protein SAY86_018074 [Trapa natans]
MSSSPPPGINSNVEEPFPYLDVSLEDLGNLWQLLDDQDNPVAQPGCSNVSVYGARGDYSSSDPHLNQAAVSLGSNISCAFPRDHGSGLPPTVSHVDTDAMMLAEPSIQHGQGLLFDHTPFRDVLMCGGDSAGHLTSMFPVEKGKGKAVQTVSLESGGEAEDENGVSWRRRTGKIRALDKPQAEGEEGSVMKKQVHNAKERARRRMVNASYLALGELLPQPRRSKKRWSAPMIVDRVVDYIPELKREVEGLMLKKEKMLEHEAEAIASSSSSSVATDAAPAATCNDQLESSPSRITVSVHDPGMGEELIVLICRLPEEGRGEDDDGLVSLLSNIEAEGLSILKASTLDTGGDLTCYHLHIKRNGSSGGPDYTAILKRKVISWLAWSHPP